MWTGEWKDDSAQCQQVVIESRGILCTRCFTSVVHHQNWGHFQLRKGAPTQYQSLKLNKVNNMVHLPPLYQPIPIPIPILICFIVLLCPNKCIYITVLHWPYRFICSHWVIKYLRNHNKMKKEIATICCLVGMAVIQLITASVSRLSTEPDNIIALSSLPSLCNGGPNSSDITAGCLAEEDDEEMMMDSEIYRRLTLEADRKRIGYGALNPDRPICNSGPRSYANCLPPASNPRTRGCNPYYQCRN